MPTNEAITSSNTPKDCNPNTPVREKVKRIQEQLSKAEEKEGKGQRYVSGRPTGKKKVMLQPTLASFMVKSGLVGPEGSREGKQTPTSGLSNPRAIGQGLSGEAKEGSLKVLGEGRKQPRKILKGSPEHNLLVEARVISPKGDCLSEQEEEGTRQDRGPMWSGFKDPGGRGTKRQRGTDTD